MGQVKINKCIKCGGEIGPFARHVWEACKLSGENVEGFCCKCIDNRPKK